MEPIKKLFQGKVFYKYKQKKTELEALQNKFLKNIPNEIRSNIKVKNKIGETLIIEAASNSIAHKIKMTSSTILNKFNNDNSLNFKKIKVQIAIQNPISKKEKKKTSISSIDNMKKLSNKIDDSPLKTYLKKIFKNK
tara:strand:+ start:476 stop:886 length:411 start_codon:yes stop_codon:yes gene_type:complete